MKIGVIYNRRSRSARRNPALSARLQEVLGPRGEVLAPEGDEGLQDALSRLQGAGCRKIALHGGDGTGHRVVTALMKVWDHDHLPELMWLHGGTMNTVSRSMGQRGRPQGQLASWVAEDEGGEPLERTRRWPLCVEEQRWGFLFGIGIVPRFIEVYEGDGQPTPVRAVGALARAVGSAFVGGPFADAFFRKIPARVTTDEHHWPGGAWSILTAGAVDQIGLSFRPFPGVLHNPGCMHVFGTGSSPVGFARDLIPLRLGRPAWHPLAYDRVCRQLVVEADEPLQYNLDGDLYRTGGRLVVRTGPSLTFVLAPGAKQPANRLQVPTAGDG